MKALSDQWIIHMIALAVPITIGLSLTHPRIFGFTWYLLVLLSVGIVLRAWHGGSKSVRTHPHELNSQLSKWPAWKVWLLAVGPLTITSLVSIFAHDLSFGRAEAIELFLGGLILAIAFNSELLGANLSVLFSAATLAGCFGLLVTIYESAFLNISRTGDNFNPINFGIACGSALLILVFWIALREEFSSGQTPSKLPSTWWNNPWILGVAAFGSGLALLHSGSRGPILAFVFSIVAALASCDIRHKLTSLSRRLRLGLASVLVMFLIGAAFVIYPRLVDALSAGNQSSDGIRWRLILIAIEQIEKSPWLGIGADQAGKLYSTFPTPISDFNHAHVTLLNVALELGIPGALSWIWAFGVFALVFSPWKFSKEPLVPILGFLVCAYLFACSMTQDLMSHSYTRKYLALIIPLLLSIHLKKD